MKEQEQHNVLQLWDVRLHSAEEIYELAWVDLGLRIVLLAAGRREMAFQNPPSVPGRLEPIAKDRSQRAVCPMLVLAVVIVGYDNEECSAQNEQRDKTLHDHRYAERTPGGCLRDSIASCV